MAFATNGTQVRCFDCGLVMTNGFCTHGSVAEVLNAESTEQQRSDLNRRLAERASPTMPPRR